MRTRGLSRLSSKIVISLALFYGGVSQFIARMWEGAAGKVREMKSLTDEFSLCRHSPALLSLAIEHSEQLMDTSYLLEHSGNMLPEEI